MGNEIYFLLEHIDDPNGCFRDSNQESESFKTVQNHQIDKSFCRNPKSLKYDKKVLKSLRKKYPANKYPGYSSMLIESEDELNRHLKLFHSVLNEHYNYGKEVNYLDRFPEFCCNILSKNIFVTLLNYGYINTTIFGDSIDNHAYVGIPLIYNDSPGFILLDGTSEQLWKSLKDPPSTTMMFIKGTKWDYKTQWANGNSLYPNQFLNLQIFRTTNRSLGRHYSRRVDYYFKKTFENQIKLSN